MEDDAGGRCGRRIVLHPPPTAPDRPPSHCNAAPAISESPTPPANFHIYAPQSPQRDYISASLPQCRRSISFFFVRFNPGCVRDFLLAHFHFGRGEKLAFLVVFFFFFMLYDVQRDSTANGGTLRNTDDDANLKYKLFRIFILIQSVSGSNFYRQN